MTKEDYERVRRELHAPDGDDPDGPPVPRRLRADELQMFEVWDSREQADQRLSHLTGNVSGGAPVSVKIEPWYSTGPD